MSITRRGLLFGLTTALLAAPHRAASAAGGRVEIVPVETWTHHRLNTQGVPEGWRTYETPGGRPTYDFRIVEDEGRRALLLRSHGDHSTITRKVQVNLRATPILEWQWKLTQFPEGADLRRRQTSDAAPHVFVVWPRRPALLRSRLIGYVWDPTLPAGTVQQSQKTGTVNFVVVRSGRSEIGRWVSERRNVFQDFSTAFGDEPEAPAAVALSIDTNDTKSSAEGFVGPIRFRSVE